MTDLEVFHELKKNVLLNYQKHYPFFSGSWKNFSSKDILQLIDLVEQEQKSTVSEKWIYTHLKPETNEKLPRKDMLDIFSKFCGFSGWDEFHHQKTKTEIQDKTEFSALKNSEKKSYLKIGILVGAVLLLGFLGWFFGFRKKENREIVITNSFNGKEIPKDEIKVYEITDNSKKDISLDEKSAIKSGKDSVKIVVESPFYKTKTVEIIPNKEATEIQLQPNDNAMAIKAFLSADIKDWKTRKSQLETMLSDDTEVIVMLKNNLGAEYFNKEDFIKQILVPSERIKKWKIVELKNDDEKVNFIRIQEE